jgi:nicotinamidase/pyrazinamidase
MTTGLGKRLGLKAGDALVVVDVQRDFLPGGSLPVPDAESIISPLNAYMDAFAARGLPIFVTRDWHPPDHCSFRASGGHWPPHCIQGSPGAAWPAELHVPPEAHVISKATERNAEAYSGFSGDHCVHDTVLDARSNGFEVVLLGDTIRAVSGNSQEAARALEDMLAHGASLHVRP